MIITFELDTKNINSIQLETLRESIKRAKHAHMTDINMRINGRDEVYEADWLKYLTEKITS